MNLDTLPTAVVQLANKVIEDGERTSKLFKSWSFPLPSSHVGGTTYHCIGEENYVRECLVMENENLELGVLEVLPYEDWWTKF